MVGRLQRMAASLAGAVLLAALCAKPAAAGEAVAGAESSAAVSPATAGSSEAAPSRWQGSLLLFDQSITTQTAGVGGDYLSYDPTYEWWVALKPRLAVYRRAADTVTLNLWMNAYLELTNSDTTTRARELQLGPTYVWASDTHVFRDRGGYKTSAALGPRVTLPSDKGARASGQILGVGVIGGVSQTFPLRGPAARALTGGRLAVSVTYNHPLNRWTSPQSDDLTVLREDVDGVSIASHQLRGQMNVREALNVSLLGDLQLTRRLDLALSYVLLNAWRYPPPAAVLTTPPTGPAVPAGNPDPTTYGVQTWLTATLGYAVRDELTVSAGYYNLANQLSPYGTRRDPLWSPAARFFVTLTLTRP